MPRPVDFNNPTPRFLLSKLGIQRDGTSYRSEACIDGQWVRFFHEWPEKIGGYEVLDLGNGEIVTNMFVVPKSVSNDIYLGRNSSLTYFNLLNNGTATSEVNRTPTSGFTPSADNSWSFALFTTLVADVPTSYILAQVNADRTDVAGQANGPIFVGDVESSAFLTQLYDGVVEMGFPQGKPILVSGGVVTINNVAVAYGNNGYITWCAAGDLSYWSDIPIGETTPVPPFHLLLHCFVGCLLP